MLLTFDFFLFQFHFSFPAVHLRYKYSLTAPPLCSQPSFQPSKWPHWQVSYARTHTQSVYMHSRSCRHRLNIVPCHAVLWIYWKTAQKKSQEEKQKTRFKIEAAAQTGMIIWEFRCFGLCCKNTVFLSLLSLHLKAFYLWASLFFLSLFRKSNVFVLFYP